MKRLRILELRKVYVDNLAAWIEVPIYEQEEVVKLVNEIDWDGLDMWQYKKNLIDHWHNLPVGVKTRAREAAVRDELYEVLVHENWGLAPGNALDQSGFYTETVSEQVRMWFASNTARGRRPDVIDG